jgi:hypothetical protein
MKNPNNTIGNRSRDLPVCSAVPQLLRHRVPLYICMYIYICVCVCVCMCMCVFVCRNYDWGVAVRHVGTNLFLSNEVKLKAALKIQHGLQFIVTLTVFKRILQDT